MASALDSFSQPSRIIYRGSVVMACHIIITHGGTSERASVVHSVHNAIKLSN